MDIAVEALREQLLPWYELHRRPLPWRRTRDPYQLVTVELMSQQTGVERIAAKWQGFVARFPTWEALADASVGDVIREWRGLGYNRRAVNLHRMARAIVERHGGVLPRDRAALLALPGVGPYTADAILSFVHGEDVPALDVNLRRVLGRVALGRDDAPLHEVAAVARAALPAGRGADWNQAVMDFAALQCTLRKPACFLCPLRAVCRYKGADAAPPRRRVAERPPPFAGSSRFLRGRIVDALRALQPGEWMSLPAMASAIGAEEIADLVAALVREGLVKEHVVAGEARFSLP